MRDFVHVDDVAAANLAGMAEVDGFTAVNVCSGRPISILEVAAALCDARDGAQSPVITGQYRSGDVRHIVADPARAAELLGFRAAVDPIEGLRQFAFAPLR
jgi:dTDP-L-rhamnose 4-epimerase